MVRNCKSCSIKSRQHLFVSIMQWLPKLKLCFPRYSGITRRFLGIFSLLFTANVRPRKPKLTQVTGVFIFALMGNFKKFLTDNVGSHRNNCKYLVVSEETPDNISPWKYILVSTCSSKWTIYLSMSMSEMSWPECLCQQPFY